VILETKVATSPEAMKETFSKMTRNRITLETGTHSPWVSRLLSELGHEAIVAHARNVRLIEESRRKDDRLDAQALARLARIDPQLLSPIQHRSPGASGSLGDPGAIWTGTRKDGTDLYSARVDEVVRRTNPRPQCEGV
jgi:transposase